MPLRDRRGDIPAIAEFLLTQVIRRNAMPAKTFAPDALERLARRRWTRLASGQGSRAPKYRHLLSDALGLADDELSLLALLILRGPQTPGELKARGERLHPFNDLASVEAALDRALS